jgi:hypothetical protein
MQVGQCLPLNIHTLGCSSVQVLACTGSQGGRVGEILPYTPDTTPKLGDQLPVSRLYLLIDVDLHHPML